jgi:arginyl-tRNA synthetase
MEKIIASILEKIYETSIPESSIQLQKTRPEFEGDITLVVFPLLKLSKKSPEQTAEQIGSELVNQEKIFTKYQVVKGFLNLTISTPYYMDLFDKQVVKNDSFGTFPKNNQGVMVEYSSPNTNKPLHLGHVRNILLGYSVANILKTTGFDVIKTQIINDRGVHICKSMLAWKKWGNGETPQHVNIKGDALVGKYYVEFGKQNKLQAQELIANGIKEDQAENATALMQEVREMLQKWENSDPETITLWKTMNSWVYQGFEKTYNTLQVNFDRLYYESDTYLYGKKIVEDGLKKGVFYQKEDGSIWVDLTGDGLDHKLLLRADGTSVYMTQDIGTAVMRFEDYPNTIKQIYTVGNEQDYHFRVLFLILQKLGYNWAKNNYHLSYGMMELPSGKMKTREGTVVDADELMQEMYDTAKSTSEELGKVGDLSEQEKETLYWTIGLGALKYFILKVDPKKKMLFDPKESIDFNGNTGPFIQYTHARIKAIERKAGTLKKSTHQEELHIAEKNLLKSILEYPEKLWEAQEKK